MAFSSLGFLFVFLPLVWVIYWTLAWLSGGRFRLLWLAAASFAFVGYPHLGNIPILAGSILGNYILGTWLVCSSKEQSGTRSRKLVLLLGLGLNIALLGCFKYANFAVANLNALGGFHLRPWTLALPLGISFFTIQQIAFLVDAYQGVAVESDLLEYTLFVSFFPRVVSGPIVSLKDIVQQLRNPSLREFRLENLSTGIYVFTIGLAKKVLVAETMGAAVGAAYANPGSLTLVEGWVASLGYTCQIYFDFSGYTDMAIGAALLFGLRLPINFDSPYKAASVVEFWKRWHITLSNFITGYLYTPMLRAFSSVTLARAMVATFAAMVLAGLWHGAAWGFVVFGALHGFALVVNQVWRKKVRIRLWRPIAWLLTFSLVNVAFVFFRASRLGDATAVLSAMAGQHGAKLPLSLEGRLGFLRGIGFQFGLVGIPTDALIKTALALPCCLVVVLWARNTRVLQLNFRPGWRSALAVAFGFVFSVLSLTGVGDFLYFNF